MRYDFNDLNYWFDRAEEMRTSAALMRDLNNREIMLRIAGDYDRLGCRAHQHPNRRHRNNSRSRNYSADLSLRR